MYTIDILHCGKGLVEDFHNRLAVWWQEPLVWVASHYAAGSMEMVFRGFHAVTFILISVAKCGVLRDLLGQGCIERFYQ